MDKNEIFEILTLYRTATDEAKANAVLALKQHEQVADHPDPNSGTSQ